MPTLKELESYYSHTINLIEDCNGELTPEIEQSLALITLDLVDKADAYNYVMKKLESEEEFFRSEAEQYLNAARSRKAHRTWLKDRIKETMISTNQSELGCFKLTTQGQKVVIPHADKLPQEFMKKEIHYTADLKLIEEVLKSGATLDFACLAPVYSLRTRKVVKEIK